MKGSGMKKTQRQQTIEANRLERVLNAEMENRQLRSLISRQEEEIADLKATHTANEKRMADWKAEADTRYKRLIDFIDARDRRVNAMKSVFQQMLILSDDVTA